MYSIFTDHIQTNNGKILLKIKSSAADKTSHQNKIHTLSHSIDFHTIAIEPSWLSDGIKIESSRIWRLFIEKERFEIESLIVSAELIDPAQDHATDSATGEFLDAIEIRNKSHLLHIGTEDGDAICARAAAYDWMPIRFKSSPSFIVQKTYGFTARIPHLRVGERLYMHLIVAENLIKPSQHDPNEEDISSWFAVDFSKLELDQRVKDIEFNKG